MKLKKVTPETLPLAKELLVSLAADLKELDAQIKTVEATGSDSPDGLTTKSGKKASKKAGKKAGKKAAKKAAAKKADVERDSNGKRITLAQKVQALVADKYSDGETFSPKDVLLGLELEEKYQVPISQVLKKLTDAETFKKISRGVYQVA